MDTLENDSVDTFHSYTAMDLIIDILKVDTSAQKSIEPIIKY